MEMFFHTIINMLWITILAAAAVIGCSVAYVVVKMVFCNPKEKTSSGDDKK